jgi:queuine tRNA-ribosyltransferase
MPVGTYGTVKGVLPDQVARWARRSSWATPSTCTCARAWRSSSAHGDLHGFMRWEGPILTDSGGFQVFSLAASAQDHRGRA